MSRRVCSACACRRLESWLRTPAGHEAPAGTPPGPDGVRRTIQFLRPTFADLSYEVHHVGAEGDLVALHLTPHGRQVDPLPGGVPVTGGKWPFA